MVSSRQVYIFITHTEILYKMLYTILVNLYAANFVYSVKQVTFAVIVFGVMIKIVWLEKMSMTS